VALGTEGYRLRSIVSAAISEIPEGTDAVLLISPQRRLRDTAIGALRRYLANGGRLVALLEPGAETGVEPLLTEYGLEPVPAVLIDPASGAVEGAAEGLNIVAYKYARHPASSGLNRNRMIFFPGARPIAARNPRPGDRVEGVVWSSPRAWATADLSVLKQRSGRIENRGEPVGYRYIMAAGRYPRDGVESRIVVFGDADFASNRYLRALYNLDVLLNSVHWAVQQESQITLRPKLRETVQFPLPMQNTLRTLYGVGLLVPEVLLIAGGVVWLRRRGPVAPAFCARSRMLTALPRNTCLSPRRITSFSRESARAASSAAYRFASLVGWSSTRISPSGDTVTVTPCGVVSLTSAPGRSTCLL
jgi:hypothetical protein